MTLRRRSDVDHVWTGFAKKSGHFAEILFYRESFVQLPGHQRFSVADADDFAILDPLDLRSVRIRNFSATDDGDFQHFSVRSRGAGSFRSSDSFRREWILAESIPIIFSLSRLCSGSFSTRNARPYDYKRLATGLSTNLNIVPTSNTARSSRRGEDRST